MCVCVCVNERGDCHRHQILDERDNSLATRQWDRVQPCCEEPRSYVPVCVYFVLCVTVVVVVWDGTIVLPPHSLSLSLKQKKNGER